MGNSAKRDMREMATEERYALAVSLRNQGLKLQDIGDRLGTSKGHVHNMIESAKRKLREATIAEAKELREKIDDRLEEIYAGLVDQGAHDGNPQLVAQALKVLDQKAKLWGAYAAQKHEVTGADGGALVVENAHDDILSRLGRLADGLRAATPDPEPQSN